MTVRGPWLSWVRRADEIPSFTAPFKIQKAIRLRGQMTVMTLSLVSANIVVRASVRRRENSETDNLRRGPQPQAPQKSSVQADLSDAIIAQRAQWTYDQYAGAKIPGRSEFKFSDMSNVRTKEY